MKLSPLETTSPIPVIDVHVPSSDLAALLRQVLAGGAEFQFCATGLSMSPFIKDGDNITISPISIEKLSLGTVIAFIQPGIDLLVVHRIVSRNRSAYLVRGDNASQADGWISTADILGYCRQVDRHGRPVSFGFGLERYPIAFLSRQGWLFQLLVLLRRLKHRADR